MMHSKNYSAMNEILIKCYGEFEKVGWEHWIEKLLLEG